MGQNASKLTTYPSRGEDRLTLPRPASSSGLIRAEPLHFPVPSIHIIQPTQVTSSSSPSLKFKSSSGRQRGQNPKLLLPDTLRTDIFSAAPLTYLTPSVPLHLRQLVMLHGGQVTQHQHKAELLLADSSSDPALAKLYSSQVVVYSSNWIRDSFLAGELLTCGDYVIYPWEVRGGGKFFPFTLADLQAAAGVPVGREEIVNECDNEENATGYDVPDQQSNFERPLNLMSNDDSMRKTGEEIEIHRPRRVLTSISPNVKHPTTGHSPHHSARRSTFNHNKPDKSNATLPYYHMQPKIAVSKRKMPVYVDSASSQEPGHVPPGPASKRIKQESHTSQHQSRLSAHQNLDDGTNNFDPRVQTSDSASNLVLSRGGTLRDDTPQPTTPVRLVPASPVRERGIVTMEFRRMVHDHIQARDKR